MPEAAERPAVAVARCADYRAGGVTAALAAVLEPLGGMGAFVRPGQRVLLKPNLLSKATPDRAVTTHPELIRAVIRAAKAAGASDVAVGDSPGGPQTRKSVAALWDAAGWTAVCEEEGARLVLFNEDVVRVESPGRALYAHFNIGREVVDCDVLIDLPKLKTHSFMMFTGAVKNLFGCIPGMEKTQYHLKVPDRDDFAAMLVDLMQACGPALAIMDAVVGMEGDGPAGGEPKQLGALLASADCVALDVVACAIAGFHPLEVYTNKAAAARGIGPTSIADVDVRGVPWQDVRPDGFAKPVSDFTRRLPKWVAPMMKRAAVSRPYLQRPSGCTSCATCRKDCPVAAIAMVDGRPVFDHDLCIRCYCCQELCPEQVIALKTPWLVRTFIAPDPARKA